MFRVRVKNVNIYNTCINYLAVIKIMEVPYLIETIGNFILNSILKFAHEDHSR